MTSFRVRHLSTSESYLVPLFCTPDGRGAVRSSLGNLAQCAPAVVHRLYAAMADGFVTVLATYRANTLAVRRANALHRQQQQDLLPQNLFELHSRALVKSDFRFAVVDGQLFRGAERLGGPIEQIEAAIQREFGARKAPVTFRFQIHAQAALDPDFALRVSEQFRYSFCMQRRRLPHLGSRKVDFTRREGLVETHLPYFHLLDAEEHRLPSLSRETYIIARDAPRRRNSSPVVNTRCILFILVFSLVAGPKSAVGPLRLKPSVIAPASSWNFTQPQRRLGRRLPRSAKLMGAAVAVIHFLRAEERPAPAGPHTD